MCKNAIFILNEQPEVTTSVASLRKPAFRQAIDRLAHPS